MGNKKPYRVRRGYVVYLNNKPYKAGQIVNMTEEEYEGQKWKVEPVHQGRGRKKKVETETTAMTEEEVENK